jgi:cyclopropane fatty-acyl-phospholipid synthase-like methyltransferase
MSDESKSREKKLFEDLVRRITLIIDPECKSSYLMHESCHAQVSVLTEIFRMGGLRPDWSVLELGSGSGVLSLALAELGLHVTAADLRDLSEQLSVPRFSHLPIRFVRQDFENGEYELESEAYDMVISVDVVEHLKNIAAYFKTAFRCLKKGGLFIVHCPNYARLTVRLKSLSNVISPVWPMRFEEFVREERYLGHVREYTPQELERAFRLFGFTVMRHTFPKCISRGRVPDYLSGSAWVGVYSLVWQMQELIRHLVPQLGAMQLIIGKKAEHSDATFA